MHNQMIYNQECIMLNQYAMVNNTFNLEEFMQLLKKMYNAAPMTLTGILRQNIMHSEL